MHSDLHTVCPILRFNGSANHSELLVEVQNHVDGRLMSVQARHRKGDADVFGWKLSL
jgi:hypothetical protein